MFHQFFSLNLLTSKSVACKPEKNFLFSKASAQLKKKNWTSYVKGLRKI